MLLRTESDFKALMCLSSTDSFTSLCKIGHLPDSICRKWFRCSDFRGARRLDGLDGRKIAETQSNHCV